MRKKRANTLAGKLGRRLQYGLGGAMTWGSSAAAIAVPLVLALARRYLPTRDSVDPDGAIDFAADSPYVTAATAGVLVATGLMIFFAYLEANRLFASLTTQNGWNAIVMLPSKAMWGIVALFGSLCLCWEFTLQLWALRVGRSIPRLYASWSDTKAGFACTRLLRWSIVLLVLPLSIGIALALPEHAGIGSRGVSVGRYAHFRSEKHPWSDVTGFVLADGIRLRDGSFEQRQTVLLTFRDGSQWNSWTLTESNSIDPALVAYITDHVHRQPETQETW